MGAGASTQGKAESVSNGESSELEKLKGDGSELVAKLERIIADKDAEIAKLKAENAKLKGDTLTAGDQIGAGPDGSPLPDGVDLVGLDPANDDSTPTSPEEVTRQYAEAFEKDLAGVELGELTSKMSSLVETVLGRRIDAKQLNGFQAYGLEGLVEQATVGPPREYGAAQLGKLVEELGAEFKLELAKPKGLDRAVVKTTIKYAGDVSRLCDLNRATIVCPNAQGLLKAATRAVEMFSTPMRMTVELEDHWFASPMCAEGYRHVQAMVRLRGVIWEVQFNTPSMIEAKHRSGHKAYKTSRYIREHVLLFAMRGDEKALRLMTDMPGVRDIADPNAVKDKDGLTALHHAAIRGDKGIAELLLELTPAADAWSVDRCGQLPLYYAMLRSNAQVTSLITSACESTVSDKVGEFQWWSLRSCLALAGAGDPARDDLSALLARIDFAPLLYVSGPVTDDMRYKAGTITRRGDSTGGQGFRYRGAHKEGDDVYDPDQPSSDYFLRLTGMCREDGSFDGTIFWYKLRSRWGNTAGLKEWQPEHVKGEVCEGWIKFGTVVADGSLTSGTYEFRILEGGFRLQRDNGYEAKSTRTVLLLEHERIPDPQGVCWNTYFDSFEPWHSDSL